MTHLELPFITEVHPGNHWILPILKFENRSRMTRPRFLPSPGPYDFIMI